MISCDRHYMVDILADWYGFDRAELNLKTDMELQSLLNELDEELPDDEDPMGDGDIPRRWP